MAKNVNFDKKWQFSPKMAKNEINDGKLTILTQKNQKRQFWKENANFHEKWPKKAVTLDRLFFGSQKNPYLEGF